MVLIDSLKTYPTYGSNAPINNNIIFETGGETQLGTAGSGISCVIADGLLGLPDNSSYMLMSFGMGDYKGELDLPILIDDGIAQFVNNLGQVVDYTNVPSSTNTYQKTITRTDGTYATIKVGNVILFPLDLIFNAVDHVIAMKLQVDMRNMGGEEESMIEVSLLYKSFQTNLNMYNNTQQDHKIVLFEIKNDKWAAEVFYGLDNSGSCRRVGYIAGGYDNAPFDNTAFYNYFTNNDNDITVSLSVDTSSFIESPTQWWQYLVLQFYGNGNLIDANNVLNIPNIDGLNLATGFVHTQTLTVNNFGRIFATACFTEDAIVKTDQGLFKIKDITIEHSINNKSIKGVSKTIYTQDKIVAIEKDAFGKNQPNKKILVAPFHKFFINNTFKMAMELVNNDSIYLTKYKQQTLYNIILETHETMRVNNIVVETLDPSTLVAKIFDGSLPNKQRNKLVKSLNAYHEKLKKKPNKTLEDYRV